MDSETRNCRNCGQNFVIEPEDFGFYKKVDVPPPQACPRCRQQRRYAWRNERVLYRRNCDLCGKSTVTIYSPNKPYKVYCPPCFWSDKWNGTDYGRDFDFSRPFFEQFQELQLQVPRIALLTKNSVNSEYTNHANNNRNCYLAFSTFDSENVLYSMNVWKVSKDSLDLHLCSLEGGAERSYECIDSFNVYRCQYGLQLRNCNNCFYCFDCRGCSDCFLSANLRNRQFYFLNEQLSKEEYLRKVGECRLGSFSHRRGLYEEWLNLMGKKALRRFANIERSSNVSGNMIFNSKNAHQVFDADRTEDTKHGIVCPDVKDSMDSYHYGFACELIYESHALIHCYNVLFTHLSYDDSHLTYCDGCHNSENLFGCVGMKSGKYAIFNKKYGEAEYIGLKEKIIAHMKKIGEYGEFFPPKLSPFGYNETQGNVYMPMTKEEALAAGYRWEDLPVGSFGKETLKPEDIPDDIKDIPDSIVGEALVCLNCKRNYNVITSELALYRKENIPVPRLCPDCRYRARIDLRSPRNLWSRQCMCDYKIYQNTVKHSHHPEGKCPNKFETPYAPERPEIVYCEQCYNAEVA